MLNLHTRMSAMNRIVVLSDQDLQRYAPSIFATEAHQRMTDKYSLIPTIDIVNSLRENGWMATMAMETKPRDKERLGFTKHLIRMRHLDHMSNSTPMVGDSHPEIVLINSHDGSSSYQLHAAFFRLVCANGLIVPDATIDQQRFRHSGDIVKQVIEGVFEVTKELPKATENIKKFQSIALSQSEAEVLAKSAILLKYDSLEESNIVPAAMLRARRSADTGRDLWSVFNVIQENMMRGGISVRTKKGSRIKTRKVSSIDNTVKLNKALWTLADEMSSIKLQGIGLH